MSPITHESSHLRVGRIVWFCAELLVAIVVAAGVAYALVGGFRLAGAAVTLPAAQASARAPSPIPPQAPQLQVTPAGDLASYRKTKQDDLDSYRWVDRERGVAQIPIESAMRLYAQEHPAAPSGRGSGGAP